MAKLKNLNKWLLVLKEDMVKSREISYKLTEMLVYFLRRNISEGKFYKGIMIPSFNILVRPKINQTKN